MSESDIAGPCIRGVEADLERGFLAFAVECKRFLALRPEDVNVGGASRTAYASLT